MSEFQKKHIGPQNHHIQEMLSFLEQKSLEDLIKKIVPETILDIDEVYAVKQVIFLFSFNL